MKKNVPFFKPFEFRKVLFGPVKVWNDLNFN
jgi:hypothetical protein